MLRGYMDNESLQHAKDELAKAEKKLKNPKTSVAGIKRTRHLRENILRELKQLKRDKKNSTTKIFMKILFLKILTALGIVYKTSLAVKTKHGYSHDPVTKRYAAF